MATATIVIRNTDFNTILKNIGYLGNYFSDQSSLLVNFYFFFSSLSRPSFLNPSLSYPAGLNKV